MFITNSFIFLLAGILVVASAAIFAVRYLKPRAAREYDIIFAVMGVIYALCLLLEGWRLIPLLQFAQVLLVALCAFFAVETFRLRLQLVEKSRGSAPPSRPPDRPFDRTYRSGRTVSSRTSESRSRIRQGTPEEEEAPRRRVAAPPRQLPRSTSGSGSSSRTRRVIRPGEGSLEDEDQAPRRDPESRRPTPESERPNRRPPPRLPEEDLEEEQILDVTSEVAEEEPPRRRTRRIVVEEVIDDEDELT